MHDQPGSHWVALWTNDGGCTVMDSFAIPLAMYKPHHLLDWLIHNFEGFESNGHAIQAVDGQACGLYALMFLIHMSIGGTLGTFMNIFSRHDFFEERWLGRAMVPTFSGTRYDLALFQTVSPSKSCPCSIVRHGAVTIKKTCCLTYDCAGSVAQRDKASHYESEESPAGVGVPAKYQFQPHWVEARRCSKGYVLAHVPLYISPYM